MNDFFAGVQGQALKQLAETLWNRGYKVFLAGGCVRDSLLGRPYKDLDVVTDASVETIQQIFVKTIPVGIQFGIVRVIVSGVEFEVARFRKDGPYVDGRHPEYVEFTGPEEDAARRDFTVNALFYDLRSQQILDFVQGRADLDQKILRAVGDPRKRFAEDYLRLLRLLRFACQLQFEVESETAKAAAELTPHLAQISGERIGVEITKALAADPLKALAGFALWDLPKILFPHWGDSAQRTSNTSWMCLKGRDQVGWLMAMWILNFQKEIGERSLNCASESDWSYNKDYLLLVDEIMRRFRLSKNDARLLKEVGAVLAWPSLWGRLRCGVRGALAQSEHFSGLTEAAEQLSVWTPEMIREVSEWRSQAPVQCLLLGQDVVGVSPEQRGLVLKESLYLQYEGVLLNREQALVWLQGRSQT
jgi:tRNA nucleotidyltransferase/poly(A) polymerase